MDICSEPLTNTALSSKIIEAAICVHKSLGPGFLESFYESALCIELEYRNIPFEPQKPVAVAYRGNTLGEHRLDLLVDGTLIVELKAVSQIDPIHFSIVRSYMKAVGTDAALILNFGSMPLTIKRVGRELPAPKFQPS